MLLHHLNILFLAHHQMSRFNLMMMMMMMAALMHHLH
jgi:hypothetical protein